MGESRKNARNWVNRGAVEVWALEHWLRLDGWRFVWSPLSKSKTFANCQRHVAAKGRRRLAGDGTGTGTGSGSGSGTETHAKATIMLAIYRPDNQVANKKATTTTMMMTTASCHSKKANINNDPCHAYASRLLACIKNDDHWQAMGYIMAVVVVLQCPSSLSLSLSSSCAHVTYERYAIADRSDRSSLKQ